MHVLLPGDLTANLIDLVKFGIEAGHGSCQGDWAVYTAISTLARSSHRNSLFLYTISLLSSFTLIRSMQFHVRCSKMMIVGVFSEEAVWHALRDYFLARSEVPGPHPSVSRLSCLRPDSVADFRMNRDPLQMLYTE